MPNQALELVPQALPDVVANFIDGGHLIKTQRRLFAPQIDFHRLAQTMANGQANVRTYYYDCLPDQSPDADAAYNKWAQHRRQFIMGLQTIAGFELRLGTLGKHVCRNCCDAVDCQKQVDTQLAADVTLLSAKRLITKAYLFAGDSDFVPVVRMAQAQRVFVHLFYGYRASTDLIAACDTATAVSLGFFQRLRRLPAADA